MKRYYTLRELLENPEILEPRKAIIPRLMWSQSRTVLASREKLGKSTLLSKAVAEVSQGGWFLGERCEQATILWVGLEEPMRDMVRRFHEFGGDLDRIIIIDKLEPVWDKHIAEVTDEIGAAGVVIDSLAMLASHCGITEENDAGQMNSKLIPQLTRLIIDTRLGVTFSAHSRKSDGTYRGSTAIGAGFDMLLEMHESKSGKTHRKISPKGRWTLEDFEVSFDGDDYTLAEGRLPLKTRVDNQVRKWPDSTVRSIRDGIGGKHEAVQQAIQELEDEGRIHNYGNSNKAAYQVVDSQPELDIGTANGSPESPLETRTEPLTGTTVVPLSKPSMSEREPLNGREVS
jgi:hypothetical protein